MLKSEVAMMLRRLDRIVLFIGTLTVIVLGSNNAMAAYKAEMYFDGAELEAVRALELGDDARLHQALASGADINRPGRQGMVPFLYFIAENKNSSNGPAYKLGAKLDYELPAALGPNFPENFGWIFGQSRHNHAEGAA